MSAKVVDFHTRLTLKPAEQPTTQYVHFGVPPTPQEIELAHKIALMLDHLEELIHEVKSGRVESFGFALVRPCGAANAGHTDSDNIAGLMGAAALLQARLAAAVEHDEQNTSGPSCG